MSAKCGVTNCSSKRKYRPHLKEVKRGKIKAKFGPYEDSRDEALLAGSVLFGAAWAEIEAAVREHKVHRSIHDTNRRTINAPLPELQIYYL
ncbi:hypothetical protein SDRG_11224 [Saprolegnia diclina VS20]|uniref:Uncharacterized protein n=1 Tax=Saprolegnia diclina (strain VS20) TaxID=1156394 RepID=T0RM60_SAPDV|nr:hypothetical protein SDRG_11224 [Saprolegnia diclina VS20]EQC31037.1 hypothetical protein SDRG_11224 [Saprolegnia diclina VS20]|eukprot:XP_008615476.1 hypothetical protein SDRG_11224 [Saprolegnia diclina VS20]